MNYLFALPFAEPGASPAVATPRPSGPRPANPLKGTAAGYLELAVNLAPGRHTVAFKCAGSEWSDDQAFYWLGK